MSNQETWVVAANGSNAKIFRVGKFPKLEVLEELDHPESRLRNQDLVTAAQGRSFESIGTARSAYQPSIDPHHQELEKFARLIGEYLTKAKRDRSFSRLYIMANPSFLGLLRPHLNGVQESIVAEIGKDVTSQSINEIEQQLENA